MNQIVKYCVSHCPGSGGMFLLNVIAQMLDIKMKNRLDPEHGDYHDGGLGDWRNTCAQVCLIGDHWFNFNNNPDATLFYIHDHHLRGRLLEKITSIQTIVISHEDDDHINIARQALGKAWPNLWTEQEYNRWVSSGCDFPPYHKDNLIDPTVHTKLLEQISLLTRKWWEDLDHDTVDDFVEYQTIMGLNDKSLAGQLSSILQRPATSEVQDMIAQYQDINKELYFND